MEKRIYHTQSERETEQVGALLAPHLKGGAVIAFLGSMGMGKTAFVRGLAEGLLVKGEVMSPTFAIVNVYAGTPNLCHFDMYRVSSFDELYSTGFFDYMNEDNILAIEWSENILGALPKETIFVRIQPGENENERVITIGEEAPN